MLSECNTHPTREVCVCVCVCEILLLPKKITGSGWGRKAPSLKKNSSGCHHSFCRTFNNKMFHHTHNVTVVWKLNQRQMGEKQPKIHFISVSLVTVF